MRILISGGFGFIGGKLAQHLAGHGHKIILGSRFKKNSPSWLPSAEVCSFNWSSSKAIDLICEDVDVVIHAAGMNAQDCYENSRQALSFNGFATERFAYSASKMGVKKFIYISTAHVYSDPLEGLITERSIPKNHHPYATSHLAGENAVIEISNKSIMQGIIIRLSNTFGAPVSINSTCWTLLINDLCLQAVRDKKLLLKSSGKQHRNFIGISNVSNAITHLLQKNFQSSKFEIYNLGSEVSNSVGDVAKLIQDRCNSILGFRPPVIKPTNKEDSKNFKSITYSIDKLKKKGVEFNAKDKIDEIDNLLKFCSKNFEA